MLKKILFFCFVFFSITYTTAQNNTSAISLEKAIEDFNAAFNYTPYGNSEYLTKISLNEKRNIITLHFQKSKPQILLERIDKMECIKFGKDDAKIRLSSNKIGYCYCSSDNDCRDYFEFDKFNQAALDKFFLHFGNIIDAWKQENKIKTKGLTYAEKNAKMRSPDFLWEIKEGKSVQIIDIPKSDFNYKSVKKIIGTTVKVGRMDLNNDFETYRGLIKTAENELMAIDNASIIPINNNIRNTGTQTIAANLYETSDPAIYENKYFNFNKKLYTVNKGDNKIEEIDFEFGKAKTIIEKDLNEKIIATATSNRYIYFATTNGNRYSLYFYDPVTTESKMLSNKQTDWLTYLENAATGEKYELYLSSFKDRIEIIYSVNKINNSTGFSAQNRKHYIVFDEDLIVRAVHTNSRINSVTDLLKFKNYGITYTGFGFTKNKLLMNIYKDETGKFHQLATATYNPKTFSYDSIKTYLLKPESMTTEKIFEAKGEVFAIVSFKDDTYSKTKRNHLYKLNEKGQLISIGNLGKGEENDLASIAIMGDHIYIKSFSAFYKYTLSLDYLKEIISYPENVIIPSDLYPSKDGHLIFRKFAKNPLGPLENMIYNWKTETVTPIIQIFNSNKDFKDTEDPFSKWISTEKFNYVIKKTNEKYALYKIDINQNLAEQVQIPNLDYLKFKEIITYAYSININHIFLKVKYLEKNKEVEKYLVYKCE